MFLGFSFASFLFVNKRGMKHVFIYASFAIVLYLRRDLLFNFAPMFLLLLFLLNHLEIKKVLILGVVLLSISSVVASVSFAQGNPQMFLVRDLVSGTTIITAGLLLPKSHKDYALAATLGLFAIFFYSYANLSSPLVQVSMPFACLSLLPYLYFSVIRRYFEGSLAYRATGRVLRFMVKRFNLKYQWLPYP